MPVVVARHPVARLATRLPVLCVVVLFALPLNTAAIEESTVEFLLNEIEQLKARVEGLEARLEQALAGSGSTGGEQRLASLDSAERPTLVESAPPVPERSVALGGRIKVDGIYNSHSAGTNSRADLAFIPGAIPVTGEGEDDQIKLSSRTSRMWVKASTPTPLGTVGAYVEMDFFSSDDSGNERVTNGYTPRMRHAYGEWRGWLAGQTYTTFMDLSAFPEINDDGAPAGAMLVRQPMLRWTNDWPGHVLQLALESPETTLRLDSGGRLAPDDDRLPDFVAKYLQLSDWGHWSLAGVVREIRVDDAAGRAAAVGGGLSASALVRIGERDDLRVVATSGNAIGRYLSLNIFDDARLDSTGDLDLIFAAGGYLAFRHWWAPRSRSNIVIGGTWMDDAGALQIENEWAYSVHTNFLWSPLLSTTLGVEWIHGERSLVSGRDGSLDRVQFSAVHKF